MPIPSSSRVRITRMAISPRFATSTLENIGWGAYLALPRPPDGPRRANRACDAAISGPGGAELPLRYEGRAHHGTPRRAPDRRADAEGQLALGLDRRVRPDDRPAHAADELLRPDR